MDSSLQILITFISTIYILCFFSVAMLLSRYVNVLKMTILPIEPDPCGKKSSKLHSFVY